MKNFNFEIDEDAARKYYNLGVFYRDFENLKVAVADISKKCLKLITIIFLHVNTLKI